MFWTKPDLWKKHAVTPVRQGGNCRIEFVRESHLTPVLDSHIKKWPDPFPGRDIEPHKIGVLGYRQDGGTLVLQCAPVSWAQYVVATKVRSELPLEERFHRLAGSCLITTSDEELILTFRSKRAERYPDVWHVGAAGYIECADVTDGTPDFAMKREIEEEVNLPEAAITDFETLGVCEHQQNAIYEICFRARTYRAANDVLAAAAHAVDASEGTLRAFSARTVKNMLRKETFNPAGAATLLMHFGL